jgi:PEP-CTERM motif
MRLLKSGLIALATTATVFATSPAFAQAYSSASIYGMTYELFDLNVGDDIQASITFSPPDVYRGAGIRDRFNTILDGHTITTPTDQPVTAASATSSASAQTTGDEMASAEVIASGIATSGTGESFASIAQVKVWFTLGANTGVKFSALSKLGTGFGVGESATAQTTFATYAANYAGPYAIGNSLHDASGAEYSSMTTQMDNQTDVEAAGMLFVRSNVFGNTQFNPVSAVPEADTLFMMLSGLGVMGALARRRKLTESTASGAQT